MPEIELSDEQKKIDHAFSVRVTVKKFEEALGFFQEGTHPSKTAIIEEIRSSLNPFDFKTSLLRIPEKKGGFNEADINSLFEQITNDEYPNKKLLAYICRSPNLKLDQDKIEKTVKLFANSSNDIPLAIEICKVYKATFSKDFKNDILVGIAGIGSLEDIKAFLRHVENVNELENADQSIIDEVFTAALDREYSEPQKSIVVGLSGKIVDSSLKMKYLNYAVNNRQWESAKGLISELVELDENTINAINTIFISTIENKSFIVPSHTERRSPIWKFIDFLFTLNDNNKLNTETLNKGFELILDKNDDHTVKTLVDSEDKFDQNIFSNFLRKVVDRDRSDLVKHFWSLQEVSQEVADYVIEKVSTSLLFELFETKVNKVSAMGMEHHFTKAAGTESVDNISKLFKSNKLHPDQISVSNALIVAVDSNNWPVVDYLVSLSGNNKPSQEAIIYCFNKAFIERQDALVKKLMGLSTDNRPDQTTVSNILKAAADNNNQDLVKFFYSLKNNKPNQESFDYVIGKVGIPFAVELCESQENIPSPNTVTALMQRIAGRGKGTADDMRKLCTLTEYTPDQKAVSDALTRATTSEWMNWEVAEYFS